MPSQRNLFSVPKLSTGFRASLTSSLMVVASWLPGAEPAAQLGPIRPATRTIIRGATPEHGVRTESLDEIGFTPAHYSRRPSLPAPANFLDHLRGLFSSDPRPAPTASEITNPAWPQPIAAITPPALTQTGSNGQPQSGTSVGSPQVYAGPPAYRWYGWGSTRPGMNPYAPGGTYPHGSVRWYSQTGATPGAFPVPMMETESLQADQPPVYATNSRFRGQSKLPGEEIPYLLERNQPTRQIQHTTSVPHQELLPPTKEWQSPKPVPSSFPVQPVMRHEPGTNGSSEKEPKRLPIISDPQPRQPLLGYPKPPELPGGVPSVPEMPRGPMLSEPIAATQNPRGVQPDVATVIRRASHAELEQSTSQPQFQPLRPKTPAEQPQPSTVKPPSPPPAQEVPQELAWKPVVEQEKILPKDQPVRGEAPPAPEITAVPEIVQFEKQKSDYKAVVERIAQGRAFEIQVEQIGPKQLIIRFVSLTEEIARETAIIVSRAEEFSGWKLTFKIRAKFQR